MRGKKGVKISLIFAAAVTVGLVVMISLSVDKSIRLSAEAALNNECEMTVNRAARKACLEVPEICDAIDIEKDSEGMITMVNVDNTIINKFSVSLTENVIADVDKWESLDISIPLSNVFFSRLLFANDIKADMTVYPNSVCSVKLASSFVESGINQTLFRIYADVSVCISARAGFFIYRVESVKRYDVCDMIIVGHVPSTFANLVEGGDFLNLVP